MEQQVPEEIIPYIRDFVHRLVAKEFALLISDGRAAQWSEDILHNIIAEVTELNGPLIDLPDEVFMREIALPVNGGGWRVDVPLWTTNGISDFTLVLDINSAAEGSSVHIEDLRIM